MLTEQLFAIEKKPRLAESEQGKAAALRDKLAVAETLGLAAQVSAIKADLASAEKGALIITPAMTETEVLIWKAWLPLAYTDLPEENQRRKLSAYQFDRIPSPVLKLWQTHKESGLFERFEIWTPEHQQPDPILVGINGNTRHLLARWGESDANMVSFEDIKRELVRRWHANETISGEDFTTNFARSERTFSAAFTGMMAGALPAVIISLFVCKGLLGLSQDAGFSVVMTSAALAMVAVGAYAYRRRTRKLFAASPLMQAIVKDNSPQRTPLPAAA